MFLLVAPAVVLYSQGYRFDFDSKKITQTGGLFLKILPKQAEIYLDGELEEKTDFFFGSVLIENLLPKKYQIKVVKEGYFPWEKTLEIKEKEVTEVKNIVLFPENLNFNIISQGVEKFWFSPNQRRIILQELDETGWSLKLYDLDKSVKSHLINETNISKKGVDLIGLEFSENSKEVSLKTAIAEQIKYFSLTLDKTPPTLTEAKQPATSSEDIIVSKKFNNDTYYLDNTGHLFKNEERLDEKPFPIQTETEYTLEIFPNFVFLKEGNTLYRFNPGLKSFEKFFDGEIKTLKISPDSEKLLLLSNYEICVLFLKDKLDQPQRKAGEKILISRLSEKIMDCLWVNPDYLIFNTQDKIRIIEIDDRDRINVIEIKNLPQITGEMEIFWNETDKNLYLLQQEILYASGVLIPG